MSTISKSINSIFFVFCIVPSVAVAADMETCFTPGQNCTAKIVNEINSAKHDLYVQAYGFTSKPIINAIIRAKNNGVHVVVILDKSQLKSKYSGLNALEINNIDTLIDKNVSIAHNKVMIIDNSKVITGSFNFTSGAQKRNAENVIFIKNAQISNEYKVNFDKRASVSVKVY